MSLSRALLAGLQPPARFFNDNGITHRNNENANTEKMNENSNSKNSENIGEDKDLNF